MDAVSDVSRRERIFGHCIVTWEIKNYGRSLWQKDLEVSTPEFSIKGPDTQVTKWKLTMQCELNHKSFVEKLKSSIEYEPTINFNSSRTSELEDLDLIDEGKEKLHFSPCDENESVYSIKNIMLCLERLKADEGPDEIWADWKVYCIDINGEKFPVAKEERYFKKSQRYLFNIGTIYDIEKDFEYNSGMMTILCDIIVKDPDHDIDFCNSATIDLQNLSKDFQWIFNRELFCDAEIKIDGKSIKVHKAILCSHSTYFEDLFENGNSNIIELSDINYYEMLKILEYIYTYDLKDVIGQPSVCVYEYATLMNLKDLAAHYSPEEYQICTVLDTKKQTFSWTIENFPVDNDCVSSPIFTNDSGESAWQIRVYPKGIDSGRKHVSIAVECIEGDLHDLSVQCTVLNDNEKLNFWKTLQKSEKADIFEDKNFISRENVVKLLKNDSLRLGLKIGKCKGNQSSILKKQCTPVLYTRENALNNMSKNLLALRHSKKYADTIFKIGEKEIKAHSYILSARSYLSEMLVEENSKILSNISPETFNVLLDYMYCAVLKITDIEKIIDVYKAAEEFVVSRLQDKCSRVLQNNATVHEAFNILRLAHTYNDKYLKQAILAFININEKKFTEHIFEELKKNLSCGSAPISEDPKNETPLESIVKKISIMKCNEESIERNNFSESLKSSNAGDETTERVNLPALCNTVENTCSPDEFKIYLIIPDDNEKQKYLEEVKTRTYENNSLRKEKLTEIDKIISSSKSPEKEILSQDKEGVIIENNHQVKEITCIKCQNEVVPLQLFTLNNCAATKDEIQNTCKITSTIILNNENRANEYTSALDESTEIGKLNKLHEEVTENNIKSTEARDTENI